MSKVAIQGNASGTGTFTIAAPNSNTDRTLTLPDEAGTVVVTDGTALHVDNTNDRVGIGTSSPAVKLHVEGGDAIIKSEYDASGTTDSLIYLSARQSGNWRNAYVGVSGYNMVFATGGTGTDPTSGAVERARIDSSGDLFLGKTSTSISLNGFRWEGAVGFAHQAFTISSGTNECFVYNNISTGGNARVDFRTANASKGYIQWNNTNTTYSTTSDYRLKNTITPMTGALAKVAALKPVTYKWNADGSDGEGFIAHELQAVCPHAVTGEKDAVDADGNPVYQGIDTSFLVATLTAAIQEQQAIIEQLQADVAALKGTA